MLGMLFRGVFLVGILTWYSTSVWKMIDGYFRDQFRSYLEEEYRKNPRMKSDVQGASVDKIGPVDAAMPEATVAPPREIPEVCEPSALSVEAVENRTAVTNSEDVTGGTSENDAARGSTDKNAFLETTAESELESRKPPGQDQESRTSINHDNYETEHKDSAEDALSISLANKELRKKSTSGTRSTTPRDISQEPETPKKRRVKTITLTERDFTSVQDNANDDFWEFEEDAEEREPLEGVLVSELPFKPRIDGIEDLERITTDEYCPLTLEDEASCGETVKWP
ncbi:uncharacterized protein LOC116427765 [Nomia melanderi]|uniref:uncharacterized protein LOC116427765 n=1 Tax=Nomia melanderi TaxID=2448451 RepID=UPI0013046A74|nr:uncharacterized protein LOC116427765 [Nomia melanderi]